MTDPKSPAEDASTSAEVDQAAAAPNESSAVETTAEQNAEPGAGKGDSDQAETGKKRVHPRDVVARFAAAWPQAFSTDPKAVKPLTVGVLKQILANRPAELDGLNSQAIRAGMKFYASRMAYHIAMLNQTHRVDLAGEQAEEITDDMRQHAQEQLDAIKALRAEKAKQSGEGDKAKPSRRRPRKAGGAEAKGEGRRLRKPAKARNAQQASSGGSSRRKQAENDGPELSLDEKLAKLAEHFGK